MIRLAILAPIAWRTPPRQYGPWEQVASTIAEGMVSRGLDVTLFATADSKTSGTLSSVIKKPYAEDPTADAKVNECLHISALMERAREFDLIHNHFDFLPLTYSGLIRTPMLTTIHGFSSEKILPVYQRFNKLTRYVSISDSDRHASLNYEATVYNGIDTSQFTFRQKVGDYLLFLGRIHPHKGLLEAIRLAHRVDKPLIIAGLVQDADYFAHEIEPLIDGEQVTYVGNVGPLHRNELLGGALALIHLINFDEPFGLSVAESMCCGTPVIANRRGSMPELIEDGISGYLVSDLEEAVDAVSRLGDIDREACYRRAVKLFSKEKMTDDYLEVYNRILGR